MNERYALRVITPPPYEPISLEETKRHIKVDDDITAYDDDIDGYIAAAREWYGDFTGRALVMTEYEMALDGYPSCSYIELPRTPVISVDSIKYTDSNGVEQTWATSNYQVDIASVPARIALAYGGLLPSSYRADLNSWRIRFTAGYPVGSPSSAEAYRQNVPALAKVAMKIHVTGIYEGTLDKLQPLAESIAWSQRASFI